MAATSGRGKKLTSAIISMGGGGGAASAGGGGGAASAGGAGGAGGASTAGLSSLGRVTTTGPGIFSLLGTALGGGAGAGGGPAAFNNSILSAGPLNNCILSVLRIRIRDLVPS